MNNLPDNVSISDKDAPWNQEEVLCHFCDEEHGIDGEGSWIEFGVHGGDIDVWVCELCASPCISCDETLTVERYNELTALGLTRKNLVSWLCAECVD